MTKREQERLFCVMLHQLVPQRFFTGRALSALGMYTWFYSIRAVCCEAKESPLDLARVARVINLMFH